MRERRKNRRAYPTLRMIPHVILVGLGIYSSSFATTREQINFQGATPYLLVSKETPDEVISKGELQPGIYVRNPNGSGWIPVVLGDVSPDRIKGGILKQLHALSNTDQRYQIISLINGKIGLYHIHSTPDVAESFVEFGSENTPLIDILTRRKVYLPEIPTTKDVNIVELPFNSDGQGLLISVRFEKPTPLGDGMTFVAVVKTGTSNERKVELLHPPLLVDYEFNSSDRLSKTVLNKKYVVSRNLIDSMSEPNPDDSPQILEWRKEMVAVAESILGLRQGPLVGAADKIPLLDLKTGHKVLPNLPEMPVKLITGRVAQLIQKYDPLHGNHYIKVAGKPEKVLGRIDLHPETKNPLVFKNDITPQYQVVSINGSLWVYDPGHQRLVEFAQMNDGPPKVLSFIGEEKDGKLYLIVSTEKVENGDPNTHVFVFEWKDYFRLMDRFAVGFDQLTDEDIFNRLVADPAESDFLLYDNQTPPTKDYTEYQKLHNPRGSYVSLAESTSREGVLRFNLPRKIGGLELQVGAKTLEAVIGDVKHSVYGSKPEQLSYYVIKKEDKATSDGVLKRVKYFLFISAVTQQGNKDTSVVRLHVTYRGGHAEKVSSMSVVQLADEFFLQEELAARATAEEHAILFDHTTPIQNSLEKYQLAYRENEYHIDVEQSGNKSEELVERFRKPREIRTLGRHATLKVFGKEEEITRPTGIYFKSPLKDQPDALEYVGEPLFLDKNENKDFILSSASAQKAKTPELKASIMALDETFQQGKTGFDLLLGIAGNTNDLKFKPVLAPLGIDVSIDRLASVHVVWGKKEKADRGFILYSVKALEKDDKVVEPAYTAAFRFEAKYVKLPDSDIPGRVEIESGKNRHLSVVMGELSQSELKNRVVYDEPGQPYFVMTADLDQAELKFEVKSLTDGTSVFPNSAVKGKKNAFKFDKKGESPWGNKQPWRIHSSNTHRTEIKLLADQDLSEYREDLFPNVNKVLDEMVDPKKPARHHVLLVSPSFKSYIKNLVLARYIDDQGPRKRWSYRNSKAPLFLYEHDKSKYNQDKILEALETIREADGRGVLVADLRDIVATNRPKLGEANFVITETSSNNPLENNPDYLIDPDEFINDDGELHFDEDGNPIEDGPPDPYDSPRPLGHSGTSPPFGPPSHQPDTLEHVEGHFVEGDVEADDLASRFEVMTSELIPHSLYLMASEGDRVPLNKFHKKVFKQDVKSKIPTLLIGTPEEWREVQEQLSVERKYGVIDSFVVEELGVPSMQERTRLFLKAINRPEFRELGLKYDTTKILGRELPQHEAKRKLIEYLVNRAEDLAKKQEKDIFTSFMKVMNLYQDSMMRDETLRKKGVVDRIFVERLFSQIFDIQLRLSTLESDDPLKMLNDPNAAIRWQQAGYKGDLDKIMVPVIDTILSQLRRVPTLKVPASIMLFGSSRTGKTYAFETLVKLLNLQYYDFKNPKSRENHKAQAFVLSVPRIRESGSGNDFDDSMSLDDAIAHLDHFLTLPNGYRGFILIDDIHQGSDKVIDRITKKLRTLLEHSSYRARSKWYKNKPIERPSNNLTLFMTFNPTEDLQRIRKFAPNYSWWNSENQHDTPELAKALAKATLNGKELQIEESFFNRWNLFLNLDKFPVQAKGPKLIESFVETAGNNLESGLVTLLAPKVVTDIVNASRDSDAKTFLSTASGELVAHAEEQTSNSHVQILVPTLETAEVPISVESNQDQLQSGRFSRIDRNEAETLKDFIRRSVKAVPASNHLGRLHLLKMMSGSFRISVYQKFVEALTRDPRFARDFQAQKEWLAPTIRALGRHLVDTQELPLKEFGLDSLEFGARNKRQREQFNQLLKKMDNEQKFFPFQLNLVNRRHGLLNALTSSDLYIDQSPKELDTLRERIPEVEKILIDKMTAQLSVKDIDDLPHPRQWMKKLTAVEKEAFDAFGERLAKDLWDFFGDIKHDPLVRNNKFITRYEIVRLYAYAIDRAVTRLPWGSVVKFMNKNMELAATDMTLGQSNAVQEFFFRNPDSLLRPVTKDGVLQMILGSAAFKKLSKEQETKLNIKFKSLCDSLLLGGGK